MRRVVTGDRIAQLRNPDPFAVPAWRSPVYRTPGWIITLVLLARLLGKLARLLARHPVATMAAIFTVLLWRMIGWPGLAALTGSLAAVLVVWRWRSPASFARFVTAPARSCWRKWCYQRRWHAVMSIGGLAPRYQGRILVPVLGRVTTTPCTDRVSVRLVSGQSSADFATAAPNLADGFRAHICRVRSARPGMVVLEFVRRDALARPIPAFPIPGHADLRALAVGCREDGLIWLIRLHGTHLLIAGSTGAGKASLLWSIIRAVLPAMRDGLVRVMAADPKRMELAYGQAIFHRHGTYAADPEAIVVMLEQAVADMQDRAARLAGKHRHHTPSPEFPFVVVVVDEVAFLTAYQPDRKLRDRTLAALATLTTQGRAVGYCVVAAVQDPRKEVLTIRNLFPTRIVMRLDEADQVDLVLGDGARDRGATADLISTDPEVGAGVAFVRLEADPDPVRVRAAWVADPDIKAMAAAYAADPGVTVPQPRPIEAGARL